MTAKPNAPLIAPDGREARIITMPIPGRDKQFAVIMYDDGHAALVDLAQCKEAPHVTTG